METDQSSQEVEAASAEEPPLGGLTRLQENPRDQNTGYRNTPVTSNKSQIVDVAHTLGVPQIASLLRTDVLNGLSIGEAARRLEQDGPNEVQATKGLSIWKILLRQFSNSLTLVLIITMAISFGINDYIEGAVISAVIVLNAVVGFMQDSRAEEQIQALKAMSAPLAKVIRSGEMSTIKAEGVVAGDLIQVGVGDKTPADARLINGINLSIDESMLTGEALTVSKEPDLILAMFIDGKPISLSDRINMIYSGTVIAQGRGKAIVVATGSRTEFGKIGGLLEDGKEERERNKNKSASARLWLSFVSQVTTILGLDGTPLVRSLSKFALLLFTLAVALTIIVFAVNRFQIQKEVLIYGICVAVAIIPESLVAVLTITQSIGAKAMAKGNVLVRKIASLEAVGGTTNICSDKTGTLTQGKMVATQAWIPEESVMGTINIVDVGHPYDPESGCIQRSGVEAPTLGSQNPESKLLRTMALCNLASVFRKKLGTALNTDTDSVDTSSGEWTAEGEPTEVALQVLAMRFGLSKPAIITHEKLQLVAEYPFSSTSKRMSVVYRGEDGTSHIFTKGATDIMMHMTTNSNSMKTLILKQMDALASQGLRVMSFGHRTFPPETAQQFKQENRKDIEQDLEFLGLVGIHDPPRPETASAVRKAQLAGIKVHMYVRSICKSLWPGLVAQLGFHDAKQLLNFLRLEPDAMLTGDHQKTAESIARTVGILPPLEPGNASHSSLVMPANDFDIKEDDEIDAMAELPLVIARCSPETKVRMVRAMHRRNAFCVMTGDGVNDAPALKRANVGIAMGRNGTDVAKEASDMVLTDDNFASIVRAVEEGRRLFDNIQKFLMHLLISNISQVFLLLIGLAFRDIDGNSVFPLAPVEILYANLVTSSFLAIGLGLERAQHDIMLRPPHDLKVGVFTRELIIDKMVYGTIMGSLCLAAFASVAYGVGEGQLGKDCNNGWNETCDVVFRARATTYATLTFLLLVTAWEVKHFKRSLFSVDPVRFQGPFSIFPALWSNQFLFWAVVAGFVFAFPVVYIPKLNTEVFKHNSITWEWGVVSFCLIMYIAMVESWKAVKRARGWGAPLSKEARLQKVRTEMLEMASSTGGTSTPV